MSRGFYVVVSGNPCEVMVVSGPVLPPRLCQGLWGSRRGVGTQGGAGDMAGPGRAQGECQDLQLLRTGHLPCAAPGSEWSLLL